MKMASQVPQRSASTRVGSGPGPVLRLQRKCACGGGGGPCASCEAEKMQRSALGAAPGHIPQSVHSVLSTAGAPLDAASQEMGARHFGHDFSRVRIHADDRAAESARQVNALAYTVGDHIVFGAGRYAPASTSGRKLLAHEMTHVVQQSGGAPGVQAQAADGISSAADPAEREAERAAELL